MSVYEWELGQFTLPRSEYAVFKQKIRDAYNKRQTECYQEAVRLREKMLKARKDGDKDSWRDLYVKSTGGRVTAYGPVYQGGRTRPMSCSDDEESDILAALFKGKTKKPITPRKKDFPTANVRTKEFVVNSDAIISFDDKARTVVWSVSENNHACEIARDTKLGYAFFSALRAVKWTRGTGGQITGNNEYNRESHGEGGANFVKDTFGKVTVHADW